MAKTKYYSLKRILERDCIYNLIFGERSNGKTYAVLEHAIRDYFTNGKELAIIRRWDDDLRANRSSSMFTALVNNGLIYDLSNGEYTHIHYYSKKWYFCSYDENQKRILAPEPFAYGFSISTMEHDKSTSYPNIGNILFDEFLTRGMYLPDEFIKFMNVLSTIIRDRHDVKIFMCGNAVNKYAPYFTEMGLINVDKMKPGDIDVYTYGNSELTLAIEFSDGIGKKKSDKYFAFNNPRLAMITGEGSIWEIDIYPHLPVKYLPKEVILTYFIVFNNNVLQCEIINKGDYVFTFIHRKTTAIKDTDNDIIFSIDHNPRQNWCRNILKPHNPSLRKIGQFFNDHKVFYQDNEIGEIVRNYLLWCKSDRLS